MRNWLLHVFREFFFSNSGKIIILNTVLTYIEIAIKFLALVLVVSMHSCLVPDALTTKLLYVVRSTCQLHGTNYITGCIHRSFIAGAHANTGICAPVSWSINLFLHFYCAGILFAYNWQSFHSDVQKQQPIAMLITGAFYLIVVLPIKFIVSLLKQWLLSSTTFLQLLQLYCFKEKCH